MRASFIAIVVAVLAAAPAAAHEATEDGHLPVIPVQAAFPVRGPVSYGDHFGGVRDHKGQDLLAACGTPVVAARTGTVIDNRYEAAAGNYLVVETVGGRGNVYMHLRAPATPAAGDLVLAGQRVGRVGRTGDASACHLHFELWTPPGWFRGGEPVDPSPLLRSLR